MHTHTSKEPNKTFDNLHVENKNGRIIELPVDNSANSNGIIRCCRSYGYEHGGYLSQQHRNYSSMHLKLK